jgi:hypothetical protein
MHIRVACRAKRNQVRHCVIPGTGCAALCGELLDSPSRRNFDTSSRLGAALVAAVVISV